MIDSRAIRCALEPLHASENTIEEVLSMAGQETNRKQHYPVHRLLAVAAVIVLMLALCGVGYAVYQHAVAERAIQIEADDPDVGVILQYSPVGESPAAEIHLYSAQEDGDMYVSAADSRHKEYLALVEWQEYYWSEDYEADRDVRLEDINRYEPYLAAYEGNAGKLESIAAKYGLYLWQEHAYTYWLKDFFDVLSIEPFMPLEADSEGEGECVGDIYDDGSFELMGVKTPRAADGEDTVEIGIHRAVKGTLCNFLILGEEPEDYTYEAYVTQSGVLVDMALGRRYSMIFAELENCYLTFTVYGGAVDMEVMRYIADNVDYAVLDADVGPEADGTARKEALAEQTAVNEARQTEQKAEQEAEWAEFEAEIEAVRQVLGSYEIAALPEAVKQAMGQFSEESNLFWLEDTSYASAMMSVSHEQMGDGEDHHVELQYFRFWKDEDREESVTAAAYESCADNYCRIVRLGDPEGEYDLRVNGCEAFFARYSNGLGELIWLDREKDLMFFLSADEATAEDLIALAESVTEA